VDQEPGDQRAAARALPRGSAQLRHRTVPDSVQSASGHRLPDWRRSVWQHNLLAVAGHREEQQPKPRSELHSKRDGQLTSRVAGIALFSYGPVRTSAPGRTRCSIAMRYVYLLFARAALAIAFAAPIARAQTTAIRFARLVDGTGRVVPDPVVLVEGERITNVGSGAKAIPAGAKVIDLRPLTGIPGLIDVHTHMTYYWDQKPGTQPWSQQGRRRSAETVFLAQENARKTLETGVTTVRDLGASEYGDIVMRDLINRGAMVGPRMFVAGFGLSRQRTPARQGA